MKTWQGMDSNSVVVLTNADDVLRLSSVYHCLLILYSYNSMSR